ncbi:hypothetical protein HWV62_16088 [Athelia sp. TMB]|nr:hypothetical protein HWV62_16088 [Athelia sp. TMB]
MHRTVDDYDSMAKREIIKAKQEKAQMRVQKFRTDYSELRAQFDRLKKDAEAQPNSTTPEHSESPFQNPSPYASMSRENYALHEHSFLETTESRLDEFLAQGRDVLDNLVDQREMLKGTQKMLLNSANTLGMSRDVIGWIERRRYAANVPQ